MTVWKEVMARESKNLVTRFMDHMYWGELAGGRRGEGRGKQIRGKGKDRLQPCTTADWNKWNKGMNTRLGLNQHIIIIIIMIIALSKHQQTPRDLCSGQRTVPEDRPGRKRVG